MLHLLIQEIDRNPFWKPKQYIATYVCHKRHVHLLPHPERFTVLTILPEIFFLSSAHHQGDYKRMYILILFKNCFAKGKVFNNKSCGKKVKFFLGKALKKLYARYNCLISVSFPPAGIISHPKASKRPLSAKRIPR